MLAKNPRSQRRQLCASRAERPCVTPDAPCAIGRAFGISGYRRVVRWTWDSIGRKDDAAHPVGQSGAPARQAGGDHGLRRSDALREQLSSGQPSREDVRVCLVLDWAPWDLWHWIVNL